MKSASLAEPLFCTRGCAEHSFKGECDKSWHSCHHFQDFDAPNVNGMKGQERHGRIDTQHEDCCQMETVYVKQEVGGMVSMAEHGILSEDVRRSRCVMFYTILGLFEQISMLETLIMGNGCMP
jgi:hypothetical protein